MAASDPFGIEELYETKDEKTLHGSLKTMTPSHQKTTTMTTDSRSTLERSTTLTT
jgi:hypothetical protein